MSKTKKISILSILALVLCLMSFVFMGVNKVKAEGNAVDLQTAWEDVKTNFTITDGASVRVDTKENGYPGIRFNTKLPLTQKANYDALINSGAEFGTIIIPQEMLQGELTLETPEILKIITKLYLEKNDNINFNAVVSNIPESAYTQDLTARGYVTYNGEIVYTNMVTRNIAQVAEKAVDAGEQKDNPNGLDQLFAYTRRIYDGSVFHIANGSASTFEYKKEAYNGNENAYHYYNQQSAGVGSYSTRLSYNVKNSDLDKYLVIKMAIPTSATTNYLYKGEFLQDGINSSFSTIYQNFDFYTPDKTFVDDWNDFYSLNGNWFYSTYYLDSTKIKTGEINITFGYSINNIELYFDTITFMSKAEFKHNFEYMPVLSNKDVKSCSPNGMFLGNSANQAIDSIGNVSTFSIKQSGYGERGFSIWGNENFSADSHVVFTIKFNTNNSVELYEIIEGGSKWNDFDFYDENYNKIDIADRKPNQWYFAVSQKTGNNNNNLYSFTSWDGDMFITTGYFYEISGETKAVLFK